MQLPPLLQKHRFSLWKIAPPGVGAYCAAHHPRACSWNTSVHRHTCISFFFQAMQHIESPLPLFPLFVSFSKNIKMWPYYSDCFCDYTQYQSQVWTHLLIQWIYLQFKLPSSPFHSQPCVPKLFSHAFANQSSPVFRTPVSACCLAFATHAPLIQRKKKKHFNWYPHKSHLLFL